LYANDNVYLVSKDMCMHTLISAQTIIEGEERPTTEQKFIDKLLKGWAVKYGEINPAVVQRGLMLADLTAVILYQNHNLASWEKAGVEVVREIGPELGRTILSKEQPACNIAVSITDKESLFEGICQTVFGE
jgi:inosine-uridine nucleoside N-ribohydrolase